MTSTANPFRPDTSELAAQLAQLIRATRRMSAPVRPILPARVADLRELAALARDDDFNGARMSGRQLAELCELAARAELARARTAGAGLRLTPAQYAELSAELAAHVALAAIERGRAVDVAQGFTSPAGHAPRWIGCYAVHMADATSGAEWSDLHGAPRAQLARNRWVQWMRLTARDEMSKHAARSAAEDGGTDGADNAERLPAARMATAERTAAELAVRMARAGRPFGKLETHAVAAILSGLTHAQRAELAGSTPEAVKTYCAKGRKALRARWMTAGAARADVRAAELAADRADLYSAAIRAVSRGPYGADPADVLPMRAKLARAERAELRADMLAGARKNAERGTSGHAGGVIRAVPTSATPEDGASQLSRVESIGKGNVSHAIHRGHAPAYRRAPIIVLSMAHRARMDRAARTARRTRTANLRTAGAALGRFGAELRAVESCHADRARAAERSAVPAAVRLAQLRG